MSACVWCCATCSASKSHLDLSGALNFAALREITYINPLATKALSFDPGWEIVCTQNTTPEACREIPDTYGEYRGLLASANSDRMQIRTICFHYTQLFIGYLCIRTRASKVNRFSCSDKARLIEMDDDLLQNGKRGKHNFTAMYLNWMASSSSLKIFLLY